MKISVIMPSFLGIPNRPNLDKKFIRAVKSFLNQTYQDKELIIISDGCNLTSKLYEENFKDNELIKFLYIPKQEPYSGAMRNYGFIVASGDIIAYLDSDDVIGKNHLQIIADQFDLNKYDAVYYNDWLVIDDKFENLQFRDVLPRWQSIGTSAICHKNPKNLEYGDQLKWSSGYGHDFIFCLKMNALGMKYKKLEKTPHYLVCHFFQHDH